MELTKKFKSLFSSEPATEVPVVSEAMKELNVGSPWASPESISRFAGRKQIIDLSSLPEGLPSEADISKLNQMDIITLRKQYPDNLGVQNYLAKYEHQLNAKEAVIEAGKSGVLPALFTAGAYSLMVPVYAEAKQNLLIPTDKETSTNKQGEVTQGWAGIGEGLKEVMGFGGTTETKQIAEGKIQYPTVKDKINDTINSLINTESSGRHEINGKLLESEAGAQGITQVLPQVGKNPGYGVKPLQNATKEEYVRFAKDYLGAMYNKFGDMEKAIAAYNAGPIKVDRAINKAERKGRDWKEFLPEETKNYIKKVNKE